MSRVLVLDALQRSALATVRSLGRNGVEVITADCTPTALAGQSRYSMLYARYPDPREDPQAFIDSVAEICTVHGVDTVLPMTEMTSALLLKDSSSIPGVALPFADIDTVLSLADKCRLARTAMQLGIPLPATRFSDRGRADDACDLGLPLVIKPALSWFEVDGRWIHSEVRIAHSSDEARHYLESDTALLHAPYMMQQYIPGSGAGVFAIYDRGKAVAFFAHRRLREKPPRGGVSVLSESTALDAACLQHAKRLLDHVSWHGVAMVEFRIADDGTPYLMEVNTRFWGSLQLAIDAGVDFPWLLYRISRGEAVDSIDSYRSGRRLRWLLGDLDWLYLTLRDRDFGIRHKLHSIISFCIPHPFSTRHEVDRLSDIRPFWWEIKQYLLALRR